MSNESYLDARDANPETGLFTKKNFHYLWLAGEQVTDDNCADLSVLNGVSGNVSYDPENKILYLNNSSISTIDQGKSVHGDVNRDRSITMADANMVVNYFLSTDKPEDFDLRAADVNGNGEITMADANQIVNMFLNGEQTEPVQ